MIKKVAQLVERYNLAPHPEGGYFCQTYKSSQMIAKKALPETFSGPRSFSTAILFLLPAGEKSHLHKILQDEVWHFYQGGPLRLVMISPEGQLTEITMGTGPDEHLQYVVPAGFWFGAEPKSGAEFSLVGCTVAPGFEFQDFTLGTQKDLLQKFPQHGELIAKFALPLEKQ